MRYFYLCLVVLIWILSIPSTHELQLAQTQVLLRLRKYLEYPTSMQLWENYYGDLCSLPASAHIGIKCEKNSVTELKIMGDKAVKVDKFNGYALPNKTLSVSFSIDSFVTTLTRLTNLRILRLVSLGIWGPLPDKIRRLSSLEVLDLSSNFLYGSVPPRVSTMVKLHTLTLDGNYLNSTMPNWFGSLSNLNVLSLKNNHLKGSFPSSLCKISSLADISLSHNKLSGALPDLTALSGLRVLDLRENHLYSELPLMPKAVVTILLSKNSFSGEIPNQYGELDQLQHLDLSSNHLSRMPPSSLFSLPKISYLNLASNELSGFLPHKFKCGTKLGFVDISSNKLNGGLPSCLISTSGKRVVKHDGNCLSVDSQPQRRGTYCKESSSGSKNFFKRKIAAAVAMIIVIFLVLSAFGILFYRKYHSREMYTRHQMLPKSVQDNSTTGVSSEILASARFISQVAKLGTQATTTNREFPIEELKEVTRNFDLSTFIGEGSLGKVYKGKLENGSYVVIRRLALSKKCSTQNLKARLDLLSKLHHPNLVSLLGHCIDGDGQDDSSGLKLHLVYEYVPNGNYHTHLSDKALRWSERLAILIGVAKAVHFLHTGVIPGCFRNQLNAHNVLLDEHHIPRISDYGLSMMSEEFEYLEAKGVNPKSCQSEKLEDDVYNFGLILFESLVGPKRREKGKEFFLDKKLSFDSQEGRNETVDPVVLSTCCPESLSIAISITTKCISSESSSPPSFEDVLWNLQYAAQVQAIADADQNSDSTS
ncbi:hypothetical protein Fmac_029240 [Flemingia macrophylla]|uniref:Protein kinase domain-containing protein n=1 Tax=Flemingia macrophylla TaxID=520843 RepID=A0ABD1L9Y4_9FABA